MGSRAMTITIGEIHLPLAILQSGAFQTAELGLTYPALMEDVDGRSHRYMLAFDGGNIPFEPGRYDSSGVFQLHSLMNRRKDFFSTKPVFWQFYVPVRLQFLRER